MVKRPQERIHPRPGRDSCLPVPGSHHDVFRGERGTVTAMVHLNGPALSGLVERGSRKDGAR
jgi:hypothetical protein